jgi:methylglutaconyl-CoA hydratase
VGRIHGKAVGGGVGIASACDYAMAKKRFNYQAIGIGPFVIEPVCDQKNWKKAMAEMTLRHTNGSRLIGLLPKVVCQYLDTIEELDKAITDFSTKLSSYNPEALEMKKYFGKERNTGTLFVTTRRYFGKLVPDFTKNALEQFKSKIE